MSAAGPIALPNETVYAFQSPPVRFGLGATADVGRELLALGVRRALIVTDGPVLAAGVPALVAEYAAAAGVETQTWSGAITEPTERSILAALEDLADVEVDGYVAVGGGSVIDTAKVLNLCRTHGGTPRDWVGAPVGEGRPIPAPLRPLIGLPTTAGTGAEFTANCMIDFDHVKASVADNLIRPAMAIIDPASTISMSPAVTAASGFDVLIQSLESYTTRPYDRRPRFSGDGARPVYSGAQPVADACCEQAIELAGRFLRRAVHNPDDLEARTGMAQATLFSRLGSAGVHLPHATGYAVAAQVRDYRPDGFALDRPLVPHGQSVAVAAPASFDFTFPAAPERHLRAARLAGAPEGRGDSRVLSDWLAGVIAECGGPTCLRDVGYDESDIPALAAETLRQRRVLAGAPRTVSEADVVGILTASLEARPLGPAA